MNTKKILIAALTGGITLFALGFIIYELIFAGSGIGINSGAEIMMLEKVNYSGIIAMELLYGLLLSVTLNWKGTFAFASGLVPGGLIGALIGFAFGLDLYSTTNMVSFNAVLFWGITYLVRYALAGGVVAITLKRFSR